MKKIIKNNAKRLNGQVYKHNDKWTNYGLRRIKIKILKKIKNIIS